jgi:thiol:disulfide interchange protein
MTATRSISASTRAAARRAAAAVAALVAAFAVTAQAVTPVSTVAQGAAPLPAPLSVDAAFPAVAAFEAGRFVVKLDVLPGHYLYRDRFELLADGKAVAKLVTPPGKVKLDPTFGRVEVYEQPVSVTAATQRAEATELTLVFQGCSAIAGVCYPPTTRSFAMNVGAKDVRPREPAAVNLKLQFKPQVSQ